MKGKKQKGKKQEIVAAAPKQVALAEAIEQAMIGGDLTNLSVPQRLSLYKATCKSLRLNWLTAPFGYIQFRETEDGTAKLVLYAKKDCTEQLRRRDGVSVEEIKYHSDDRFIRVTAYVKDRDGRKDGATGVIPLTQYSRKTQKEYTLQGLALANAEMKCETKAKRRATLSICGLGILDESELDTLVKGVDYNEVSESGRVVEIKETENPALTAYEEREAEGIKKLSPEQREILTRKLEEARAKAGSPGGDTPGPVLAADAEGGEKTTDSEGIAGTAAEVYEGLTCQSKVDSGTYRIEGPESLLRANRELLRPFYRKDGNPPGIIATAEQFGKLIGQFEKANIKFRIL